MQNTQRKIVMNNYSEKSPSAHSVPPWISRNPMNPREFMSYRIPPNAKCPCGSGKKFKKCCAYIAPPAEDPQPAGQDAPEKTDQVGQ